MKNGVPKIVKKKEIWNPARNNTGKNALNKPCFKKKLLSKIIVGKTEGSRKLGTRIQLLDSKG